MHIPADLTFYLELGLEILLVLTLGYCVVLERRLAAVRKGQEGLKTHIGELNMAIAGAGASLRALKSAAGEAASVLDERLKRARLHIDELSVLTASGERIASRMETAASMPPSDNGAPLAPSGNGAPLAPSGNGAPLARGAREIADMPLPSTSILSRLERALP